MSILGILAAAILLCSPVRTTYYGPDYTGGELTASGAAYQVDGYTCALGPELLAQARAISGEEWPTVWLCLGGECTPLRVTDTGAEGLQVDLPDETWRELTGSDPAAGVAYASIWVGR